MHFSPMPRGVPIFPETLRNLNPMLMKALPSITLLSDPLSSSVCGLCGLTAEVGVFVEGVFSGVGVAVQHLPNPSIKVRSRRLKLAHAQRNSCSARLFSPRLPNVTGDFELVVDFMAVFVVSLAVLVERDSMAMVRYFACLHSSFALVYVVCLMLFSHFYHFDLKRFV